MKITGEFEKAVIVIPVYKTQLSVYEQISLAQCRSVLSSHTIIFVKPVSLNIDEVVYCAGFPTVNFDDHYFQSIYGYNELLMTEAFYKSFSKYEYMLIYQLDAFVFSDQVNYWCNKAFDYIGAPWLRLKPYKNLFDKVFTGAKNYLYMRYDAKYKNGLPKTGKQIENRVGNGGFSLRKTDKFAALCVQYKSLIDHYVELKHPWFNEDIFWSIALNRKIEQIKKPSFKEAARFSIETNPQLGFKLTGNQLPFGCHGWDKNVEFWRPLFKQAGIDI